MSIKDCLHEPFAGVCLVCSPADGWQHHSECLKADPDVCFPEDDEPHLYEEARLLCRQCPVVAYCLELGWDEKFGMWGGFTPTQRQREARSGRVPSERLARREYLRVLAVTAIRTDVLKQKLF